jgi:hypothetical protein
MVDQDTKELGHKIVDEAIRLEKENLLLRALVRQAYNEGFSEGVREHTTYHGGKPWAQSRACKALS